MPRTVAKSTYNVRDMWDAYIKIKQKENPEWWTKYCYVYRWADFSLWKLENGRPVEVMNYTRFNKIIRAYFNRAKKAIIKGEALNLMAGVGKLCARRVERDFRKPKQVQIDWGKTRKQPLVWNEEEQKMKYANVIYFTDDEWCRIGWHKTMALPNEKMYEFKAATGTGEKGFKTAFVKALMADPLLKYNYLFFPLSNYKPKNLVK